MLKLQGRSKAGTPLTLSFDEMNRNNIEDSLRAFNIPQTAIPAASGVTRSNISCRQSPMANRISFKNLSTWHQKELLKLNTIASTMQPDLAKLRERLFTKSTATTKEPVLLTEGFVAKLKKTVADHKVGHQVPTVMWAQ